MRRGAGTSPIGSAGKRNRPTEKKRPAPDGAGHEKGLVMKEKAKVFVIDAVDIIWEWLFAHDLLVSIVSSIIGSVFGVWLAFELIQIITKT